MIGTVEVEVGKVVVTSVVEVSVIVEDITMVLIDVTVSETVSVV